MEEVPVRFLGANSFTEIHNGKDAQINGIESDINYVRGGLTLNAAAAYTDAKTKGNICNESSDTTPDCTADIDGDRTDFITAPSGHGCRSRRSSRRLHCALHVAGMGRREGARPGRHHLSGLGAVVAPNADPARRNRSSIVEPERVPGPAAFATLVDLFAGLDWPRWSLEAVRDEHLRQAQRAQRASPHAEAARATLVVPGRPRTIGIRAGMKF